MKMNEVLVMGGAQHFMQPAANLRPQVVQPQTRQAVVPEQDNPNEPTKKAVVMKQLDIEKINKIKTDILKNYFDSDSEWKEIESEVDKSIKSLERREKKSKKKAAQDGKDERSPH